MSAKPKCYVTFRNGVMHFDVAAYLASAEGSDMLRRISEWGKQFDESPRYTITNKGRDMLKGGE